MHYVIIFIFSIVFGQIDTVVTIDASNHNEWIYFSFDQGEVVDIDNPENSLDWDISIQRKHIRTNSGLSGFGNGGGYVDSSLVWIDEWNNINYLPENISFLEDTLLNDFYDISTHTFVEGNKNPALNSWGWFDESYVLNVTHYLFFVRLANGEDVVKFWPFNYYSQNGLGGHITIRYQTGFSIDSECSSILGDINNDLIINVIDIIQIVSFIIEDIDLNDCQLELVDMNQDGIINVIDIIAIIDIIVGS